MMNRQVQWNDQGQTRYVQLYGSIHFDNACQLRQAVSPLFKGAPRQIEMDFTSVSEVNTAAFTLLLEWLRQAKKCGITLVFHHLPERLAQYAQQFGLSYLFQSGLS